MQKTVKFEGFRPFLISMKFKAVYYLQNGTMEFLYLDVSRPSWQYRERLQSQFLWEIFLSRLAARQLAVWREKKK